MASGEIQRPRDWRPGHLPALDGLRGIAVLMVMLFHAAEFGLPTKHSILNAGVDLFFVLSGFLITRILLEAKGKPRFFRNFFGRRSLRIFPLYYAALGVYLLVRPILSGNPIPPFADQVYFWIYLQNIPYTFGGVRIEPGHFWSLAIEEHFYLFWPVLIRFLKPRRMQWVFLVLIASALLLRWPMLERGWSPYYFTFTRIDALAGGALLAFVERFRHQWFRKLHLPALRAFVALLVGTLLLSSLTGFEDLRLFPVVWPSLMMTLFVFLIGGIASAPRNSSIFGNVLKCRALCWTGTISYGLYVWHPFAYLITRRVIADDSPLVSSFVGIGLSFIIAVLSYYGFERWFLRLKKKFV